CPLAQPGFLEKLAAEGAGFAATAIHQQRLLKIAWFAVATDEVAQGGAALLNGALQYILDVARQPLIAFETDAPGTTLGMNATEEQRLIGVDIAHAHHDMAVHDETLDGAGAPARALEQIGAGELVAQGLWPQIAQQRVGEGLRLQPQHGAK